jgi:peroxidase
MSSSKWYLRMSRKSRVASERPTSPLTVETLEDRSVPSATGYRPIDAVGNNVANPNFGIAGIDLLRISPARYRVVAGTDPNGFFTPSMNGGAPFFVAGSRLVSNDLSNQSPVLFDPNPAHDINTVNQNGLSGFGYTFGQFLDHDMGLTPDTPVNDFPIPKDPKHDGVATTGVPQPEILDPLTVGPDDALRMGRSVFNPATGITSPREQINVNTAYLDLSQVYGSTNSIAASLRTFSNGLLKTSPGADGLIGTGDDLLPFNNTSYFTAGEIAALNMANDAHIFPNSSLFAAGDVRANETTELTSLHTLFVRNHNRLAGILKTLHPFWNDEQLYQEARALNIAQYQQITYEGYLAALLGPNAIPQYTGYDPTVNPSISTEFSTVSFRFGHSLLNNNVPRVDNNGNSLGDIPLLLSFFNPSYLTPGNPSFTDIGAVLKGDASINAQAMDEMGVTSIRNLLFGVDGIGEDLIARDLWRAHDHGIGTYNDMRIALGLAPITDTGGGTFADYVEGQPFHGFEQISSDPAVVTKLVIAYAGPTREAFLLNGKFAGDIDPFAAGMAEDHVPGSDLGPLFHANLVEQFTRLRDGDRFFYKNQDWTLAEQLLRLQGNTLSKLIKLNTNITNIQSDVFRFLAQQDGKSKGYYASEAGRTELTGSATGTTISAPIYNALVAALAKPGDPSKLVLVDAFGNNISASSLQSYNNLKNFLLAPGGSLNAAFGLSQQLLATQLNLILGKVDANSSVFVPAVSGVGVLEEGALQDNNVTNPSGIAGVQALIDAAKAELLASPFTTILSSNYLYQSALNDVLAGVNSDESIFILP